MSKFKRNNNIYGLGFGISPLFQIIWIFPVSRAAEHSRVVMTYIQDASWHKEQQYIWFRSGNLKNFQDIRALPVLEESGSNLRLMNYMQFDVQWQRNKNVYGFGSRPLPVRVPILKRWGLRRGTCDLSAKMTGPIFKHFLYLGVGTIFWALPISGESGPPPELIQYILFDAPWHKKQDRYGLGLGIATVLMICKHFLYLGVQDRPPVVVPSRPFDTPRHKKQECIWFRGQAPNNYFLYLLFLAVWDDPQGLDLMYLINQLNSQYIGLWKPYVSISDRF